MEYKVYRQTNQHLVPERIKILSKKDASIEELAGAIHDLGELGDSILHDRVAPFLTHPNPRLRYEALSTLGFHWMLSQYRPQFEEMMRTDPDEHARSAAASCLGLVLKGTRDKAAARHLIVKIRDEKEEGMVREAAYEALLDVWAPESEAHKSWIRKKRKTTAERNLEAAIHRARPGEDTSALFEKWERLWMQWVDWRLVDTIAKEIQLDKV